MRYRKLPDGACRHLMAKMMLYPAAVKEDAPPHEFWDTDHYWCNETQREMGPDGDVVNPKECACGRPCWEAQKRSEQAAV